MPKRSKNQGRGQGMQAGRGTGQGSGRGGSGEGGGMGGGGFCVCPKCGQRFPHQPGAPCLKQRCPTCGVATVREGSSHHQEIESRRTKNDEAR